jgi:hypothetical protein
MSRNRPVTENELEQEPKAGRHSIVWIAKFSPTRRFLVILSPQGGLERKVTCFGVLFKRSEKLAHYGLSACRHPSYLKRASIASLHCASEAVAAHRPHDIAARGVRPHGRRSRDSQTERHELASTPRIARVRIQGFLEESRSQVDKLLFRFSGRSH